MKRLIYIATFIVLALSCNKYDDAWISSEFNTVNEHIRQIESLCNNFNKDIVAMQGIISAIEQNDMVTDLLYVAEDNSLSLTFRDRGVITITVSDGNDGEDVYTTPVISVRKDTDNIWYWTIDDEWCMDKDGNKIPTLSDSDVTPRLKVEDEHWYVSYDGGTTWDKLGKATGENGSNGDLIISGFVSKDNMVYITLANGEELVIPMENPLGINISSPSNEIIAGQTFTLTFEIIGSTTRPEITCIGEHGWKADVKWNSDIQGELVVKAPAELKRGKIVVFVSCGDYTTMKAVNFEYDVTEAKVMSIVNDYFEVDGGGGVVEIKMLTNQVYSIQIPESAKSWISHIRTKSLRDESILFAVSANPSGNSPRSAVVKFVGNGINESVTISQRSKILLDSEIEIGPTDGFDNPTNGIVVLQTASKGNGTDLIIMGDGFSKRDFIQDYHYKTVMEQAYEDFFSVEPYASLKDYFNVYYINAVSEDAHDAQPYYDAYGNQNGATNGTANTCFSTSFKQGSTSVTGDATSVQEYAKQAIRYKGGPNGTACSSESEIRTRVNKALMLVMINVECYAGTCFLVWTNSTREDYGNAYSIAYCPLGTNGDRNQRKWTIVHEAGGHGFGKLADEYEVATFTRFSTSEWTELASLHSYGVDRNVNEYWTYEESLNWSTLDWEYTTTDNVYWAELLRNQYNYVSSEGLSIYSGGYTYTNMFCRSSYNSVMRNHHTETGRYFNAISRWAIWYRLMRLTQSTDATNFKASLDDFIEFDKTLSIKTNYAVNGAICNGTQEDSYMPLGKTQKVEMVWDGDELRPVNYVRNL